MDLNVGKWLRTWLASVTAVTDLVGARIFPGGVPQGTAFPALVYERQPTALEADQAGGFTDPVQAKVRVSAWSTDYDEALACLSALITALAPDQVRGEDWGGLEAASCIAILSGDEFLVTQDANQTQVYAPWVDLEICYR